MMKREKEIVLTLCDKFPFLHEKIAVVREKRVFTKTLEKEEFEKVLRFAHDTMGFIRAHEVIGTDDGENIGLLYLISGADQIILILRVSVPKSNPVISSISDMYLSIVLHERELVDLFGVIVEGLPEGLSYPLPDGWPKGSFPLRKEWNPKNLNKDTMVYEPDRETEGKE